MSAWSTVSGLRQQWTPRAPRLPHPRTMHADLGRVPGGPVPHMAAPVGPGICWEARLPDSAIGLPAWPGVEALGLEHGESIGSGTTGTVSRLYRSARPGGWPDGGAPVSGATLAAKWIRARKAPQREDVAMEVESLRVLAGERHVVRLFHAFWDTIGLRAVLIMELGVMSVSRFTRQHGHLDRGMCQRFALAPAQPPSTRPPSSIATSPPRMWYCAPTAEVSC